MKSFRVSDLKDLGAGSCSLERMHGPITKSHHDFLESVVPGELDELISKDLLDRGPARAIGSDWDAMTANNPSWAATIPTEPPPYYDLRSERDELQVEVHQLSAQLERLENQLKMYKHRGDMLQGQLMTLREEALNFCRLYEECVDRTKLGGAVEALQQSGHGANATLAAYGEDPY